MSTPFIWIIFPGGLAGLLLIFRRRKWLVTVSSTVACLFLGSLAWWLPGDEYFFIGPWTVRIVETWSVLGRSFILGMDDRPALVVIFLGTALWFGAASVARTGSSFVPIGLGMVALLTAAIAVEPFLYAALILEIAVLVSIPLLARPGKPVGRGVLRYLTFQTLGIPFILMTGWTLTGIEANPGELGVVLRASVLMGIGFAILLAVFPFHTWIPMLSQESHPYAASFIFLLLPAAITFFGLGFLDRFAWLRNSEVVYIVLRAAGVLMVVTAGLWAAFQRHLGRMLGYAVILEIGLSLIAISLVQGEQVERFLGILFAALLPRGISLGVWALALTMIWFRSEQLDYRSVQGIARSAPLAAGSLVLAHFSLAGLPLLAGFPVRLALLEGLSQVSLITAFWTLVGSVGLMVGGLRTLAVLIMGPDEDEWRVSESPVERVYLAAGIIGMLVIGLFPQWFLPVFAEMSAAFRNLVP